MKLKGWRALVKKSACLSGRGTLRLSVADHGQVVVHKVPLKALYIVRPQYQRPVRRRLIAPRMFSDSLEDAHDMFLLWSLESRGGLYMRTLQGRTLIALRPDKNALQRDYPSLHA